MRVQHFDRLDLRLDASTVREIVGGDMLVDGIGAHVGNYTYHDDKGAPFVEFVSAATLFEPASLDSAAGADVTIRHPPGLVTEDNYRDVTHGTWVSAWDAGGGKMGVRLRLKTAESKAMIRDSQNDGDPVELSPAYEVDVIADAGQNEHGHHDAVQQKRRYNANALLGPGEARGGAGMRLQLDGPECAPEGSRIQVSRGPRLDSAPRVALHSATGRPNTMKHATFKLDGKAKVWALTEAKARALLSIVSKSDAIETGTIVITIEGEEPSELVLPVSMIEMLLEGIGASSATAPADPMAEELAEEEVELAANDAPKIDAKALAAEVSRQLDAREVTRARLDARSVSVRTDAAKLLPPEYDFGVAWTQVALDAIVRVSPESEARAKALAARIDSGDQVAEGMLRQMLSGLAAGRTTATAGVNIDRTDSKASGETLNNPVPPHERRPRAGGDA